MSSCARYRLTERLSDRAGKQLGVSGCERVSGRSSGRKGDRNHLPEGKADRRRGVSDDVAVRLGDIRCNIRGGAHEADDVALACKLVNLRRSRLRGRKISRAWAECHVSFVRRCGRPEGLSGESEPATAAAHATYREESICPGLLPQRRNSDAAA